MADIMNSIAGTYNYVIDDLSDPRTRHLPLISSPIPVFITVALYLKLCTDYGPRFMRDRKAYELKYPIMLYNIFQILLNVFFVNLGLNYLLSPDYNFICDPVVVNEDPFRNAAAVSSWWYFFGKITELLDTVFFVFRKKSRQISTLHLYHHSMVTILAWVGTKYFPVGPLYLVGTLNSFVHVIMYSYYFLSGLGPRIQKYLWWKRHVTLIQLVQFTIIIAHNTIALFQDCNYPKLFHLCLIVNTSIVFYMFSKFYYNSYKKVLPKKTEDVTTEIQQTNIRHRKKLSIGQ